MKKVNYITLIEMLSEKTGLTKKEVRSVMDSFIEEIKSLKEVGDKIYLRKLGKFEIVKMKSKLVSLNNKVEKIPDRNKLKFKVTYHED